MKTRLYIGNLASTVTEAELKEKFTSLFSSHAGEAEVGNVEIRCKNNDNFFGYVDVHLNQSDNGNSGVGGVNGLPFFVQKDIDRLNNTKWKGSMIKVQVAKESFIDKLKREQLENRKNGGNQTPVQREIVEVDNSEKGRNKRHANDVLNQLNKFTDRKNKFNKFQDQNVNDNDGHHHKKANRNCSFEIVSSESTISASPPKATSSPLAKEKKPKKRSKKDETSSSEDDADDDVRDGIPKFKGLLMCYPDGIPEAKTAVQSEEKEEDEEKTVIESEEEEAEEEKPTVISAMRQKLLALAFEEDARKKSPVKLQHATPKSPVKLHHPTLQSPVKLQEPTPKSPQNKPGIIFKKSKQQKSDLLRLQSMEKMKELKAQQNSLIKSSLSSVAASAPITEQRKLLESDEDDGSASREDGKGPQKKKSKMSLFDDDDDEDEVDNLENGGNDGDAFKVRKQFEGASGQKLLELQTRFANDDRFKIDDRFKESDGEEDEIEAVEQEKEKQFDILTGILGKVVTSTKPPSTQKKGNAANKEPFSSVIMPRYDPDEDDNNEKMDIEEEKSSSKEATKEKTSKTESEESKEKVIRSTEPATFKTVSNLKALFSSTDGGNEKDKDNDAPAPALFSKPASTAGTQPQSSFSLLATFGKNEEDDGQIKADTKAKTKSSESSADGPRTFWQSNPFRYDSSDDEGDDSSKVKVTIKPQEKPAAAAPLVMHGKSPFFFTKNDERFKDLEDFFLKKEETVNMGGGEGGEGAKDEAEVKKNMMEDFALKRIELKSIVKAKIRNSRRKDEKRTLAIKRAIRKKKRKVYQKSKRF